MFKQLHLNITLAEALVLMPKYQKMLKALLSNKKKLQELANTPLNENCSAVIFKKLPEKLRDPGKFLILCGFSELKCKALADLGASINLMPLYVWKKVGLPDLIPTRMTLELANRAICTPDGIARDVFVPVGKFTFPADFVVVDYESDPRVPLILGRPLLRTARALIDVHGEEMILRDRDERLTLNIKHDTASYSNHPHRESVNLINIFNVSKGCNFLSEELPDIDSFNDIHPYFDDNPLSGSTTYSSNSLLEEFTDELALITYPPDYDDNLTCDIESDLREIEFLLYKAKVLISRIRSIKQILLIILLIPHPRCSPMNMLLIIISTEIRRDFSRDDDLPSPDNEDKVFNPGILIQEKSVTIITRVAQEKKLAISYASLVFEDFDPPFYEPIIFKDVPNSMRLLPFSFENEEKVFKPGIYTFEKVKENQEKDKIESKPNKNEKQQRDKSLNSLANAASLHIFDTKVINCLTCDVIFYGSSAIALRVEYASGSTVRHYSHLDITSDHMPGSVGKTSITPDSVHAGGRVHYGSPNVDHFSSDLHFDRLGLLDLLTLFKERSTSMVVIICRLSSHLVSRRTTRAFVPVLLRWNTCSLIMNISRLSFWVYSCFKSSIVIVSPKNSSCCSGYLMSVPVHLSVASDLIFLSWKLCLCFHRASVEDARPSGSHFFDSFSNCSLKILLGSSKGCIFSSVLFTGSLPLMEKLSSLLAKLDIESSRSAG
nr:reverse transcriptase domain-containing protein [Tanacetum cinerariifolium]